MTLTISVEIVTDLESGTILHKSHLQSRLAPNRKLWKAVIGHSWPISNFSDNIAIRVSVGDSWIRNNVTHPTGRYWMWLSKCKASFDISSLLSTSFQQWSSVAQKNSLLIGHSSFKDKKCNRTHHIKNWLVVGIPPKRNATVLYNLVRCVHHVPPDSTVSQRAGWWANHPLISQRRRRISLVSTFRKSLRFFCYRKSATTEVTAL